MPSRYEIVDEPVETLEVVDDEVYHPDLTIRDAPVTSFRSLEPIIAGPITLKTLLYDPRWSTNKRRCCVCFVATASLVCFSLLISLFVGLGQVISYINESERLRQTGLYMVPDLEQLDIGVFVYNSDKKFTDINSKYVNALDAYLEKYRKQSDDYQKCGNNNQSPGNGKPCQFDLNWLGTNCTSENRYGYFDGNPCILFALRNVKNWAPNISEGYLRSRGELRSRIDKGLQQFDEYHLPLTCSMSYSTGTKVPDDESFKYYPEAGFNLTFLNTAKYASDPEMLPPLVFVQFSRPPYNLHPQLNVKCQIWAPTLERFRGVTTIEFEFDNADDIQGTALDRP